LAFCHHNVFPDVFCGCYIDPTKDQDLFVILQWIYISFYDGLRRPSFGLGMINVIKA